MTLAPWLPKLQERMVDANGRNIEAFDPAAIESLYRHKQHVFIPPIAKPLRVNVKGLTEISPVVKPLRVNAEGLAETSIRTMAVRPVNRKLL